MPSAVGDFIPPPGKLTESVQSAGATARAGVKAELAVASAYSAPAFAAGCRTRFSAASRVLVGAADPLTVVAENNPVHAAALGVADAHAFRRFATVSMINAGDMPFAENVAPGLDPADVSARAAAVAKAFAMPVEFVEEAPTFPPGATN